jgi:hypothetical protein
LLPYLWSDTARYFFTHENGSLFEWEQIVQFRSEDSALIIERIEQEAEETDETITPQKARELYVQSLFSEVE